MIGDVPGKLLARWGDGGGHKEYSRREIGSLLAISIGLGSLFNENVEAERHWIQTFHQSLGCRPIVAILRGEIDQVLHLVNKERNL